MDESFHLKKWLKSQNRGNTFSEELFLIIRSNKRGHGRVGKECGGVGKAKIFITV